MKRVSSFLACAIGCAFLAAPAWADNDNAVINQTSDSGGNGVFIEQIMNYGGNSAVVNQVGDPYSYGSGNNQVNLMQQAVAGSSVEVYQGGQGNDFRISQFNGYNLHAIVNADSWYGDVGGEFNTLQIEQSGFDSLARVQQSGSAYSQANIRQNGWGGGQNIAEIMQSGYGNQATIEQAGSNLTASIQQMGGSFNASIVQTGGSYGNVAMIRQFY
jgi:hypothetical protein